jgi:hypothetical protein
LEHAVAAVKLRRAAEIYCAKNEFARFAPRFPKSQSDRQRFETLAAMSADALVADVQANPESYTRTLLTDLAQHHLVAALNIDVEQFKRGIHQAGLYEGLHSVAGRVTSAGAAAVSSGLSQIPGVSHALKAGKKAIKVLAHQLPNNIVNPFLTGKLRTFTDVKESFKRVGGLPVVAPQIDNSPDMGQIARMVKVRRRALHEAVNRFQQACGSPDGDPHALGQLVDSFVSLHEAADLQYRRRIGLNRTQTYSKGWGTAVNAVAAAGTVVTATVPVAGQIAGPVILAATIPMQWGAGYLDERRVKHRYNLRANTKWADFLTEDAARIHFMDLQPKHISEAALRRSFTTQPEVQVAAIREVYEDALGELILKHAKLEQEIGAQLNIGTPARALVPQRERLLQLGDDIDRAKLHVEAFESFDMELWGRIPEDSVIGKCLDDLKALERANRKARFRKPGETAQIVQRYAQVFHAGLSSGVTLPILDAITMTDSLYTHDQQGHATALHPHAEAGALVTGVTGGAVFTAATGEVRMGKAANKKALSRAQVSAEQYDAHAAQWVFSAGERRVDMRNTAGYHRLVYSTWDEMKQIGRTLPNSLFSGPIGLTHLLRAKMQEIRKAKEEMRSALNAIAESGATRIEPTAARRANNLSSMKDELYDYLAVREHLGIADV